MEQFITFWQHLPEHIKPNIIAIGFFELRYYGLMYLLAFLSTYLLAIYRIKNKEVPFHKEIIQNYFLKVIFAVIIGGRLGYVLFYNLKYYLQYPLEIFLPLQFKDGVHYTGIYGMSYHGGLIGVILVSLIFTYKNKIDFWRFMDFLATLVPLGYTFGRIGNFINGELYGRITNSKIGMYFSLAPTYQLRHPSQLYEAFFEGIFLFVVLWSLRKIKAFSGFLLSLYLIGYGSLRFFIEFFREPDAQIGFIFGILTLGQILCLAMIIAGLIIFGLRRRSK